MARAAAQRSSAVLNPVMAARPARAMAPGDLPGKRFQRLSAGPIQCFAIRDHFGSGELMEVVTTPVAVAEDWRPTGGTHYYLVVHMEGGGRYEAAQGSFHQAPGDLVLLGPGGGCRAEHRDGAHLLRWSLPAGLLEPMLLAAPATPLLLPGADPAVALLSRFARDLASESERLDGDHEERLLVQLCGLVAATVDAATSAAPSHPSPGPAVELRRVLTYIEAHWRDARLTAGRAARDLGMSRRRLHALFAATRTTFAETVARRRLRAAFEMLRDPAHDNLTVAAVAMAAGFNDLSAFHRRFARNYGIPPGEARRRRHARGAP